MHKCIDKPDLHWLRYRVSHIFRQANPGFLLIGLLGTTLQWCHNGCDGISNHQPRDCLLNRLFRRRLKKTTKLHVTGLCVGNSPVTGEFPAQMASNTENVSIWWHHYWFSYDCHTSKCIWKCCLHNVGHFVLVLKHHYMVVIVSTQRLKVIYCWLNDKLWYLQHSCVGDTIVYH